MKKTLLITGALLLFGISQIFGQKITISSATSSSGNAALAIDGNTGTRWESLFSDPQWIKFQFAAADTVGKVTIKWEGANAKNYYLMGSMDGTIWDTIATKTNMPNMPRTDTIKNINKEYAYLQVYGTARNLTYGYSIFEFVAYQLVTPVLTSLTITPASPSIIVGLSQAFVCSGKDQIEDPFALSSATTWSVDLATATIDENGVFSATRPGFYNITASNSGLQKTLKVEVIPSEANVAIGKKAYASTPLPTAGNNALRAIDNNGATRWESAAADPQWWLVDLGSMKSISGIRIDWEGASAKDYTIEGSNDSIVWTPFITKTNMPAGARSDAEYNLTENNYRYVRFNGTARTTNYGYSFWEFKVYAAAKIIPIISFSNPADINYGDTLGDDQLNANTDIAGTFSYTPVAGAKLNAGAAQEITVNFTPDDTALYASASKTVYINVNKVALPITWENPDTIAYGDELNAVALNASIDTSEVKGIVEYSHSIGEILNAGDQTLTVTFTPNDTLNYEVVSKSVTIVVIPAASSVTWDNPASIIYGTLLNSLQLNASSDLAGTYTYTPASGTKLTSGSKILSVKFKPSNTNYAESATSVTIIVNKATPAITWANPSDIVEGTALSAAQLNASAGIAGAYVYAPASGTKLSVGNDQELKVDFTPTDTNYVAASKTVKINVTAAPITAVASTENTLEIYPNPFAEKIIIKNAASYSQVALYDMLGNVILSSAIKSDIIELSSDNVKSGSYILKLKGNSSNIVKMIIKK